MDRNLKTRLPEQFIELVKIDSLTGSEDIFAKFLEKKIGNLGAKSVRDKYGNVYGFLNGTGEPIFLSAHLDTVEPGRNIRPLIKNGYVVSNGKTILGADNKVAIACYLEAIRFLRSKKISHQPVEFIFTKSEEVGNYGAINFDYSLLKSKIGYCLDSVSPVGTIITASPYYERFDLTLIGKSAHASKPEQAKNVLLVLNELLSHLKFGKIDRDTLFNVGIISGGTVRNTIPGEILLKGEIRSFTEEKIDKLKNNLIINLKKITIKTKTKYKIEFVRENPGYKFMNASTEHLIQTIARKMLRLDITPKITDSWGVSDANIFNQKKLTCINLGDGVENAHTINERVKIRDMEKNLNLILSLIKND